MTKQKSIKFIMSFMLIAIMASSLVMPAFAIDPDWYNEISLFPTQKRASHNNALTGVIQILMYNYSVPARAHIVNSGGVDGIYGAGTVNAVAEYQDVLSNQGVYISVDGDCGPMTWPYMARLMNNASVDAITERFTSNSHCLYSGNKIMQTIDYGSYYRAYYYNESGTPSYTFFQGSM